MGKVSKTASKSMTIAANKEVKVIPDAELARQYGEERAAGIWPSLQKSDALRREYARILAENIAALTLINQYMTVQRTDLDDALRNLLQMLVTTQGNFADIEKELAQLKNSVIVPPASPDGIYILATTPDNSEPGLISVTQGLDSTGE